MFDADYTLGSHRWPLVRVRGTGCPEVVLLSTRFLPVTTHWDKVTFLCPGEGCACCEFMPGRGLFYLAVGCGGTVCLLELGAHSASWFEQHAKCLHGGMRVGLVFRLSRSGAKQPVKSEVVREVEKAREVSLLDLASHVMALYKMPPPNVGEDLHAYEARVRLITLSRCRRKAESLIKVTRN